MARPKAIVPVNVERNFIRMMLYGKPDAGKSVLAGTSPKALFLASDKEELLSASIHGSNADMWLCPDYDELDEAVEWVRHEGIDEYEWVWIDNGTLMQDQAMDTIMDDAHAKNTKQSLWVPDKPQYLINQNRFARSVRILKGLPIHFGITAHEMVIEWLDGSEVLVPQFQGGKGQYSERLCGYMNIVGHMTSRNRKDGTFEGKLRVRHRPDSNDGMAIMAKDRYRALGRQVVDPTIPKMMEDIRKVLPTLGKRVKPQSVKKGTPTPSKAAPAKVAAKKAPASKKTSGPAKVPAKKATSTTKKGR